MTNFYPKRHYLTVAIVSLSVFTRLIPFFLQIVANVLLRALHGHIYLRILPFLWYTALFLAYKILSGEDDSKISSAKTYKIRLICSKALEKLFNVSFRRLKASPVKISLPNLTQVPFRHFFTGSLNSHGHVAIFMIHNTFCPIVLSSSGGWGPSASIAFKRLASLISIKRNEPYHQVMRFIRLKISFSLVRSAHRCLRGSRSAFHRPVFSNPVELVSSEAQIQD